MFSWETNQGFWMFFDSSIYAAWVQGWYVDPWKESPHKELNYEGNQTYK